MRIKRGKVKFYDKTRGFGFITKDDDKKDVYFSIEDVEKKQKLEAGDAVKFEVEKTQQGMKATRISKIE